jgi:hypothetical protein
VSILSVLISVVLGWSSVAASEWLPRIFWGLAWMVFSGFVLFVFESESELANDHLCVTGQVISSRRTRRSVQTRYSYVAPDGATYEKVSHLGRWREFHEGEAIPVLFAPLKPEISKPLASFMFYRFDALDSTNL